MRGLPFLYLLMFCGCVAEPYTTQLLRTWTDPLASMKGNANNKMLVVALIKDETSRRAIESAMVKYLGGEGVASFAVLQESAVSQEDEKLLRQVLTSGEYTHVLFIRLTDTQDGEPYLPGVISGMYGNYGLYYTHCAHNYTNDGYFKITGKYCFEVMVYTVNANQLVWSGVSATVNTFEFERVANEIAEMVTSEMRTESFIK